MREMIIEITERFRGRERGEGPTGHHLPPELAQVAGNRNNCQKKGKAPNNWPKRVQNQNNHWMLKSLY